MHAAVGRGAYGEVYRATMRAPGGLETEVALKVLRADVELKGEALRRMRDEGRALSRVTHPNILAVHDIVLLDGRPALITEFVEGADLGNVMAQPPIPGPRALLEMTADVAAGLAAAHDAIGPNGQPLRLVHRDVKPANIRLGRHGQVKLLDFGIAWTASADREARTATGMLVGSLPFIGPERFTEKNARPAGDVFSLGCVLYQCLVGERFHKATSMADLTSLAMDKQRYEWHLDSRLARLPDGLPPLVSDLLGDMLAHDPDDRPTPRGVMSMCESLQTDVGGPSLRTWASQRDWPRREGIDAPFVGRTITETTISTAVPKRPDAAPTFNFDGKRTIDRSFDAVEEEMAPVKARKPVAASPPPIPVNLASSALSPAFGTPAPTAESLRTDPVPAPPAAGPPRPAATIQPDEPLNPQDIRMSAVDTLLFEGMPELARQAAQAAKAKDSGKATVSYEPDEIDQARTEGDLASRPKMSREVYEQLPPELKERVTDEMLAAEPERVADQQREPRTSEAPGVMKSVALAGAGMGVVFVVALAAGLGAAAVVGVAMYLR